MTFCIAGLAVAVALVTSSATPDNRDMSNGNLIHTWPYSDQPYCVVLTKPELVPAGAKSLWICSITINAGAKEGNAGEHVVSVRSTDQGAHWSEPLAVEGNLTRDSAYSTIFATPTGRVYVSYNINLDDTHSIRGKPIKRVDELGHFAMRFSDDGAKTWSPERYEIPYRVTAIDAANSFGDAGATKMMWSVDQAKTRNGSVYYAFTKIGAYSQAPPQEGWFLASHNLLSETDPANVKWELLPEGEHGPGPVGGDCAFPSNGTSCVAEEWHILPLHQSPGFFAVFRTTQGFLGASHTADPTGRTGWVPSYYAQYASTNGSPGVLGGALKNPRGPITLKRFGNGRYLMLWYNNGETSFAGDAGLNNRMPYWLSAGTETSVGSIVFSQPEVVLFNRSAIPTKATCRPGYPDFVEDVDGRCCLLLILHCLLPMFYSPMLLANTTLAREDTCYICYCCYYTH
jgi:hypothetical protein